MSFFGDWWNALKSQGGSGPSLPWWLSALMNILPIPSALKPLIPILWGIIASLPVEKKQEVIAELQLAAVNSKLKGDPSVFSRELHNQVGIIHRHCEGIACPPELK